MKRYILPVCLCCLLGLAACYDDESTLATKENRVNAITIEGLTDTSAIAYNTVLELTPVVKGFTDEELSYTWYIYGGEYDGKTPEGYRSIKIGKEKKLSYPVELKIGTYSIVCEVAHNKTGYFGIAEFSLKVTSAFSEGFYILKETGEGNTELDFYNNRQNELIKNVLTSTQGAPLPGKPRNMNTVFNKTYIDPATANSTFATGIFVACGENEFATYSTIDMSEIFDRSTLLYSEMEADEIPYAMATAMSNNFYFSNKGVRSDQLGGGFFASEYATGQMGFPEGTGSSTFVQACDGQGLSFWDETNHRLMFAGGNYVSEIEYKDGYDGTKIPWDNVSAIATGWSHRAGMNTIWYLFKTQAGERYLAILNTNITINEVRKLDPSLHIAQTDLIAGNALTSSSVYSIHNNQMYRYSLTEGTETKAIPLTDLPAGDITYVADLFYSSSFDYILIGTQNGSEYTISMYGIAGGQPNGKPIHTASGTGTLKKVCYACPLPQYPNPNYYAFTKYAELYGMGPDFPY